MSFDTLTSLISYPADGVITEFAIPDKFYDASDVKLFYVDVLGQESAFAVGADFSIVITATDPTPPARKSGKAVFVTPPTFGGSVIVFIWPDVDQDQPFEGQPVTPRQNERVHDRHAMRDASLRELLFRGFRAPLNAAPALRYIEVGAAGRVPVYAPDGSGSLIEGPVAQALEDAATIALEAAQIAQAAATYIAGFEDELTQLPTLLPTAIAARDQAVAAASGAAVNQWKTTRAVAVAAQPYTPGLVIGVFADETQGGGETRYVVNGAGALPSIPAYIADNRIRDVSRTVQPSIDVRFYGVVGDGVTDDSTALENALRSGLPIHAVRGMKIMINRMLTSTAPIDFNLNTAEVVNNTESARAIEVTYAFGGAKTATIDIANHKAMLADTSGLSVGDRVKIVSNNRQSGNRPAPIADPGADYWQAQTMTIETLVVNTEITFREPFDPFMTLATNAKVMKVNGNTCRIYNGKMYCTAGFAATRFNGMVTVYGGSNHRLFFIETPNSNTTPFNFYSADGLDVFECNIRNVGRTSDASGSHGVSAQASNSVRIMHNSFERTRHGFSNNDTPTQWATNDYFTMGLTRDVIISHNTNEGDAASAFSTHHGIYGCTISHNIIRGGSYGVGIRGRKISVFGNMIEGCETGIFAYSEEDVPTLERTDDIYIHGNVSRNHSARGLQIQKCRTVRVGSNTWSGNSPRGWFLNENIKVIFLGVNEFSSAGIFANNDNFLHTVNTPVEGNADLVIDIAGMTTTGTNRAIYSSSTGDFVWYGEIRAKAPAGIERILFYNGNGEVFANLRTNKASSLANNVYANNALAARFTFVTFDGAFSSAYQTQTAIADLVVSNNNANDAEVIKVVLTAGGAFSASALPDGKFQGQKMTILASGANTFTVPSTLPNVNAVSGTKVIPANGFASYYWLASAWRLAA